MTRKSTENSTEQDTNDLSGSSAEDLQDYEACESPGQMQLQYEEAYKTYQEISLTWPSQTVCHDGTSILVGTSPDEEHKSATSILSISQEKGLVVKETRTPSELNRIRITENAVYAITDSEILRFTPGLSPSDTSRISGGYALSTLRDTAFFADGNSLCMRRDTDKRHTVLGEIDKENKPGRPGAAIPDHLSQIHSTAPITQTSALVATRTLFHMDSRSGSADQWHVSKTDINSVSYNGANLVLFGDDSGLLHLWDLRAQEVLETIAFHKSPVTQVSFSSPDTFTTSSEFEVALWDTTFSEEWEYHKYLGFVHQGQKYYKDFHHITQSTIVTSSYDGLCVFESIQ